MKRIIIIALILTIVSLGAVSAADNTTEIEKTDISQGDLLTDNEKQNLNVELEFADYVLKEEGDVATPIRFTNFPQDYKENIQLDIDGKNKRTITPDDYDYTDLEVRSLSYGKHTIHAILPETDKYNGLNLTHTFEVTKGYINIPKESDGEASVGLYMLEGATGYLTVKVDGKQIGKAKLQDRGDLSSAFVSLSSLTKGTHQIEATYSGDGKYEKITRKGTISVQPDIYMQIELPYVNVVNEGAPACSYGSKQNVVKIYISDEAQKDPEVTIDNLKYDTVKKNDIYYVDVTALRPGMHTIKATYPGDKKYSSKTIVEEYEVTCDISFNNSYVFEKKVLYNKDNIYLKLPNDAKGNLSVYIDNKLFNTVPIVNNIASVPLTGLKLGYYDLFANYTGDDYNVSSFSKQIQIVPKITGPKSMMEGENKFLLFEMNSDLNITLKVSAQGKKFNIPIINGKGNLSLAFLKCEEWGIEIHTTYKNGTYEIDDYYTVKVNVPVKFTMKSDITMYYGDSRTYSIQIRNENGRLLNGDYVKIKIGSKTTNVKTNSKGIAKINLENTPGTYTITTTFHGYKTTNKLVVKQSLTLKTATVKKSAKTLTLQATLKNTKPITGKQITFKFNGKKYTTKTDKKGIAKITVKKSVLSKLKVGKKITYEATYVKNTVKKTATVKR